MSKQTSKRRVVLRDHGTHDNTNQSGFNPHRFNIPDRGWSRDRNSSNSTCDPMIEQRHDRSAHFISSDCPRKKRPPLLKTPSSSSSRPQIYTHEDTSAQTHASVEMNSHSKYRPSRNIQRGIVQRCAESKVSRDDKTKGGIGSSTAAIHSYDNQSFDDLPSSTSSTKIIDVNHRFPSDKNCQKDVPQNQDGDNSTEGNAFSFSTSIHNKKPAKEAAASEVLNAPDTSVHCQIFRSTAENKSSLVNTSATTRFDEKNSYKTSSKEFEVEYVVLTPKSTKSKSKSRAVKNDMANFSKKDNDLKIDDCNAVSPQQTDTPPNHQPTTLPDSPYPNLIVQPISPGISQTNFALQNYPVHQQSSMPTPSRNLQYLPATGSYTGPPPSSTVSVPQGNEFVNPYRCLVTPQYPILNVIPAANPSFYPDNNVMTSIAETTVHTNALQDMPPPPADLQNELVNYQASSKTNVGLHTEKMAGSENKSMSISDREEVYHEQVENKRVRKERPSTPKSHIKLEHLFSLIESIHDVQQLKAASNIVREIIRVLPLKRNASISWVDKETILHAIDELGEHFENHIKLQIRGSVLRYGFQAINTDFVPDVTNTKCGIDDDEFSNKYKTSKGFVKKTNSDSDSGSDSEQARRLVDNKYYVCWISREYCKHICMQRLTIKEKGDKGEPISFKGFKWGHPLLTADLETSFIVRPEHRVPFYQWLGKSTPSKPPKKKRGTKPGQPDHLIMKVNLTKPKSGLKGLPLNLCECEFWEFNGTNRKCSVSYKYPRGMKKITAFLAENHPLQPTSFDKTKLQQIIFDCD